MPDDLAVRPLSEQPETPQRSAPPRLAVGIALLAIGGLLGWAAASIGSNDSTTVTTSAIELEPTATTIVPRDPRPTPEVQWTQASVPALPASLAYRGTTDVVQLGESLFFVVNFLDPDTG